MTVATSAIDWCLQDDGVPGEVEIYPKNQPQRLVMQDTSPNLLFDGPWGTGKTFGGAAKAAVVGFAFPGNRVALVRKKRVDLKPTLWKQFVDECLPPSEVVASNDTDLYRRISNGTEFYGAGLDSTQQVNKLASRQYGFVVVEEAREITEDDFDEKISRCMRLPSVPFHQVLLLTNPDAPTHWIHKRFFPEQPGYKRIQGTLLNDLPATYYDRIDGLKGVFRLRYKDGLWVSFEGLVYAFDPSKHVITDYNGITKDTIPKDWQRVLVIDFGFDHPFCAHWWAITPSDVWLLYRQIYMTRRLVSSHADDILKHCQADGIRPVAICDHDAEGRATLESKGIETVAAVKDRLDGQQTVFEKFENDQIFFFRDTLAELDQRLLMEGKPVRTEDEFASYIWANKAKEDMVKKKDDGMDTMRYAIHTMLVKGLPFEPFVMEW